MNNTPQKLNNNTDTLGPMHDLMQGLLEWKKLGLLRAIDFYQTELVYQQSIKQQQPIHDLVLIIMAVLSKQVGDGHVCLNVMSFINNFKAFINPDSAMLSIGKKSTQELQGLLAKDSLLLSNNTLSALLNASTANDLLALLKSSFAVTTNEQATQKITPFYLKGERLYLQRFYQYETTIATSIQSRLQTVSSLAQVGSPMNSILNAAIKTLFVYDTQEEANAALSQRVACAIASRSQFSVITGGPGTGKTTTVVKLLAALQAIAGSRSDATNKLRISLAAPTGKAAARLNQSINEKVSELPFEDLPGNVCKDDIPVRVTTLHQLLGSRFNSRQFVYNGKNTLPLDVLVIDEASMVDVDMMACVFKALPDNARLILLGDKDQLASVDAGAVLGDLAQSGHLQNYTSSTIKWLASVLEIEISELSHLQQSTPSLLSQNIAMLDHSYRFDQSSGIRALATEVNQGQLSHSLLSRFQNSQLIDCLWLAQDVSASISANSEYKLSANVLEHIKTGTPTEFFNAGNNRKLHKHEIAPPVAYQHYLSILRQHSLDINDSQESWDKLAKEVLIAFDKFRVLCAMREGPWGTENVNRCIEQALIKAQDRSKISNWYQGRPVLITKNDYNLNLMNGDIGIAINTPLGSSESNAETKIRVAFFSNDGTNSIRWFSVNRLQHLQTAFAMTVHKSQGSEFEHACLVLPEKVNPVLTKELVYTAITRAKSWFSLLTPNPSVLEKAVSTKISRDSGLLVEL